MSALSDIVSEVNDMWAAGPIMESPDPFKAAASSPTHVKFCGHCDSYKVQDFIGRVIKTHYECTLKCRCTCDHATLNKKYGGARTMQHCSLDSRGCIVVGCKCEYHDGL